MGSNPYGSSNFVVPAYAYDNYDSSYVPYIVTPNPTPTDDQGTVANVTSDTHSGILFMSTRDDGKPGWSSEKQILLGTTGDTKSIYSKKQNGIYRTREYKFRFTDNTPMAISKTEEEVVLLDQQFTSQE